MILLLESKVLQPIIVLVIISCLTFIIRLVTNRQNTSYMICTEGERRWEALTCHCEMVSYTLHLWVEYNSWVEWNSCAIWTSCSAQLRSQRFRRNVDFQSRTKVWHSLADNYVSRLLSPAVFCTLIDVIWKIKIHLWDKYCDSSD